MLEHHRLHGKRCLCLRRPQCRQAQPGNGGADEGGGLTAGVADLCVMLPGGQGRLARVEEPPRAGKATRSESSRIFASVLGHPYAVVRTLDEAIAVLKAWGALK